MYSEAELQVMEQDIAAFAAEGVKGVVFGCLTSDGRIDQHALQRYVLYLLPLDRPDLRWTERAQAGQSVWRHRRDVPSRF